MSKYMQIDISVIPFFEVPFEKAFPHLVETFRRLGYGEVLLKEPSFYKLIDTLATLYDHPDTPSDIKERLGPFVDKLHHLKARAREHLLARRLDELDRSLYEIEDQFEDLEGVL